MCLCDTQEVKMHHGWSHMASGDKEPLAPLTGAAAVLIQGFEEYKSDSNIVVLVKHSEQQAASQLFALKHGGGAPTVSTWVQCASPS
ncbi:hypothetical protein E2C01_080208 [Portunus trituberculatus]|uniref:Uncharacterized protein n=1 Tax=Portunus trituberculatus TaxID=210409 RepID=A0A5B7INP6_PORTR|nr:hypothetical protein [Portunus trituberculatus]